MTETTNETTADLATLRGQLPLRKLQVIGIYGPEDALRALLRTPGGQIRDVGVGDAVARGTVTAIDTDRVMLNTGTGQTVLRLPDAPRAAA